MPAPAYKPSPEALRLILQWHCSRATGRRTRPYAKEICARLGIGVVTLRKVARQVSP
jgi:hypothetical protein